MFLSEICWWLIKMNLIKCLIETEANPPYLKELSGQSVSFKHTAWKTDWNGYGNKIKCFGEKRIVILT